MLYGNTIPNGFSFDDDYVTYNNDQVKKGFKGIPEILTSRYSLKENHTFGYRPVAKVTYAIEYQFFGENPHISHFINVLLYAVSGIVLYIFLSMVFSRFNPFILFITTLLFIAHPVHTEVVASLKNREEILSFLFGIISVITLIRFIKKRKPSDIIVSVISIILAIFSKLNAATFILIIPFALYFASSEVGLFTRLRELLRRTPKVSKMKKQGTVADPVVFKENRRENVKPLLRVHFKATINTIIRAVFVLSRFFINAVFRILKYLRKNIFILSGSLLFLMISLLTGVTVTWFMSSVAGIFFLTVSGQYTLKKIFSPRGFISVQALLSAALLAGIFGDKLHFVYSKIFALSFLFIALFLIIYFIIRNRNNGRILFYDFFSNKYLIAFHLIYINFGFISLIVIGKTDVSMYVAPLLLMLACFVLLAIITIIRRYSIKDALNENKWLIIGSVLFINNVNGTLAVENFMVREVLYLSSFLVTILIFHFRNGNLSLHFYQFITALQLSRSGFLRRFVDFFHVIQRSLLRIAEIIHKPLRRFFMLLKKLLSALPIPFIKVLNAVCKVHKSVHPTLRMLALLSVVFALVAYFTIKTPDRYLPPEKIKGAVTLLQNPLHVNQDKGSITATGFSVLFFYLKKIIFPHPLLFYYGYNMIPVTGWTNYTVIISLIIHIIIIALAIAGIRKKSPFALGILLYLFSISIFSNLIVPVNGIVAERFLYTASAGFVICLVYGVFRLFRADIDSPVFTFKKNIPAISILSIVFILYSYKTISRNSDWKDHISLYSADIGYLENSARANVIYAGTLYGKLFANLQPGNELTSGQMESADLIVKHYRQGLRIDSTFSNAWNNLGVVYTLIYKLPEKGIQCFEKALLNDSSDYETCFNLGYACYMNGDSTRAEKYYRKSISINIQYPKAFISLNDMLIRQKRFREATALNHELAAANANLDIPYINIGNICLLQSDTNGCISNWEHAFQLNPDNLGNCLNLAGIWRIKNEPDKSVYYTEQAGRIQSSTR